MFFSQLWRLKVQDQGPSGLVLSGAISWLIDSHLLCVLCGFSGCPCDKTSGECLFIIRTPVLSNKSPHMTSFNLNYLHKGPVSKYSHLGGYGFNISTGRGSGVHRSVDLWRRSSNHNNCFLGKLSVSACLDIFSHVSFQTRFFHSERYLFASIPVRD